MERGFPILILCLGGLILVYAGLLFYVKDPSHIPYSVSSKIVDPKRYTEQFSKTLAIVAAAPIIAGIVGLFAGSLVCAILLAVGLVFFIWLGAKQMKNVQ